jgi:hypothetical protein
MQPSPKAKRFLALAWVVVKGFFWPVLLALGIVLYGRWGPWQPSKEQKDAVQAFFAILLFIMFFYGQYKRVEKQSEDKDSFKSVNDQLLTLEDLVRKIRSSEATPTTIPKVSVGDTAALLAESRDLLKSGHTLAALLQGGVAFEHAVRSAANRYRKDQPGYAPLHQLIQRLALVLPNQVVSELHALRMIRNRLTHVSEYELSDLPDANRVLSGYEWAVSELSAVGQHQVAA